MGKLWKKSEKYRSVLLLDIKILYQKRKNRVARIFLCEM
jgi:hypothetical protein